MRRTLAAVAAVAVTLSGAVGAATSADAAPVQPEDVTSAPLMPGTPHVGGGNAEAVLGSDAIFTLTPRTAGDGTRMDLFSRAMVTTPTGVALGEPVRIGSAAAYAMAEHEGTLAYLGWPDARLVLRAPDGTETRPSWGGAEGLADFGPSSLSDTWLAAHRWIFHRTTGASFEMQAIGLPAGVEDSGVHGVSVTEDRVVWGAQGWSADDELFTVVNTMALGASGPEGPVTTVDGARSSEDGFVEPVGISDTGDPVWFATSWEPVGDDYRYSTSVRWRPLTPPQTSREIALTSSDYPARASVSGSEVSVGFDTTGTALFTVDLDAPAAGARTGWFSVASVLAVRGSLVATESYEPGPLYLADLAGGSITSGEELPPSVSRLDPPSGSPLGGTRVTVTGTGLAGVTQVAFGGVPGTDLVQLSAGAVQVTAPAGAEGTVPVVVTTAGGSSAVSPSSRFTYASYVAVPPQRVLTDWVVAPGVVRCVQVSGEVGVPSGATGVFVNVTTVAPNGPGYVVVYPDTAGTGATVAPLASTVNFEPGVDVANAAFVALPGNGKVCYSTRGATSVGVLIDVAGYTVAGAGLVMQTSTRVLDTRPGAFHVGTVTGPVTPGQVYTVQVSGQAGVPVGARAALVNVTVTGATGPGNLRVFAAGTAVPGTSVVNFAPGKDKANAAIVALSATGGLSFYSDTVAGTSVNPVQVIIDVVGYVEVGSVFTAITPARALDTRPGTQVGPIAGTLTHRQVYALDVSSKVPAAATAVVLNVTAVAPSAAGNLRVYPDTAGTGRTPPPGTSSINYVPGRDIPNMVVVALPANGTIDLYSDQISGTTHVVVDIVGYIGAASRP